MRPPASPGQTLDKSEDHPTVYADPKGFFTIVPPASWSVEEYPQDPRGKVAFKDPTTGNELRVLVKATGTADIDALIANLKQKERELGVNMTMEQVAFNGLPVLKRSMPS